MTQKPAPWQKLGLNLKMGLRACDEAHWLLLMICLMMIPPEDASFQPKQDLLDHRHEDVFSALPNSTASGGSTENDHWHLVNNCPDLSKRGSLTPST